jgi:ribonuclease D
VIRDDTLLELAKQLPDTVDALRRIRGITEKIERRHARALLDIVQGPKDSSLSGVPRSHRPESPEDEALANRLGELVKKHCSQTQISPTLVASRRMLREFVAAPLDSPLLRGWRKSFIGDELYAVLSGRPAAAYPADAACAPDHVG